MRLVACPAKFLHVRHERPRAAEPWSGTRVPVTDTLMQRTSHSEAVLFWPGSEVENPDSKISAPPATSASGASSVQAEPGSLCKLGGSGITGLLLLAASAMDRLLAAAFAAMLWLSAAEDPGDWLGANGWSKLLNGM